MHYTVMKDECIENLNIKSDGKYVDCTLGYAGDSEEILKRVKKGFLFAFDQDIDAINWSTEKLKKTGDNFLIIKSNFLYMKEELESRGINKVDGILFDLGVSSPQLDDETRGFSYRFDNRLDMRMDKSSELDAYYVVNNYPLEKLAYIIDKYGEEKYAYSIAKNICRARSVKPIETTFELVDIIRNSMKVKDTKGKHPAKKTFQAIRIEVNHEIEILENSIRKALSMLDVNGRLVVVTFHSLEDRIVKNVFNEVTKIDDVIKGMPNIPNEMLPDFKLINKHVILPSDKELSENNRSHSSKLRVIERIK